MSGDGVLQVALAMLGLAVVTGPGVALGWLVRRRPFDLGVAAAVAAGSAGLSFLVLGGLVLNLLPAGLSRSGWLGFGSAVAGAALVVWLSGHGAPADLGQRAHGESDGVPRGPRLRVNEAAAFGVAALLVVAAIAVAGLGVHQPSEPFTQLWVVPQSNGTTQVGVANHEADPVVYRVDLVIGGAVASTYPGIRLAPGDSWTTNVALTIPTASRLEARLYRADEPSKIYRQAVLWPPNPSP